jgi:hypothetical protein
MAIRTISLRRTRPSAYGPEHVCTAFAIVLTWAIQGQGQTTIDPELDSEYAVHVG